MYRDVMLEFDFRIGQLLAALERAGHLENTLVFFTSDNIPTNQCIDTIDQTSFFLLGESG